MNPGGRQEHSKISSAAGGEEGGQERRGGRWRWREERGRWGPGGEEGWVGCWMGTRLG